MNNHRSGFIRLILLIVAALLILSYFGVSLRSIANSQAGSDNFGFIKEVGLKIWDFAVNVWHDYLEPTALKAWNDFIQPYIWDPILQNLDKLRK